MKKITAETPNVLRHFDKMLVAYKKKKKRDRNKCNNARGTGDKSFLIAMNNSILLNEKRNKK